MPKSTSKWTPDGVRFYPEPLLWPPVLCLGAPKWFKDGSEDARDRPGALKIVKRSKNRTQDDQKGPKIDTAGHHKR